MEPTTATIDMKAMREALITDAAERRGIEIGMCLAAAILVRTFDQPVFAQEIMGAGGIDREKLAALIEARDLEDYDAAPLLKIVD